jgi:class 3 adenylate cyclase
MRLSLQVKCTAALLFVGLLPLGIAAARMYTLQREALQSAEQALELAVADEAARLVAERLDRKAGTVRAVGARLTDARLDDENRLLLARDAFIQDDTLDEIAVLDATGRPLDAIVRAGDHPKVAVTVPDELLGRGATSAGEWYWSGTTPMFALPLRPGGEVTSWLVGVTRQAELGALMRETSEARFGAEGTLVMVGPGGRVWASSGGPLTQGLDATSDPLFARAFGGATPLNARFVLTLPFVEKGTPMIGTVVTFPEAHIAVAARRPESVAFALLGKTQRAIVIGFAILGALVLVFGAVFARLATRPIASLTATVRAYAQRRFDVSAGVKTGDELEELSTSLSDMAGAIARGEREISRRAVVEAGLSRYLPHELAEQIAQGKATLRLGGHKRRIVVVFADIASFTPYAERTDPTKVVALLNEVFSLISEIVLREGGMVDKFMGDCVMAVFGAHDDTEDYELACQHALRAADDMHQLVEAARLRFLELYDADVSLGIGVAGGEALVGNLGSERRMEFTVIGDSVNLAARLESLARPGQTLCSAGIMPAYGQFLSLGSHPIRGRSAPVEIYELCS